MAKRYLVDLRGLSPADRKSTFEMIDGFSFVAARVFGESGLEYADVIWDRPEPFPTSPVFPHGCPYQEIT